ncbi:hypothetical protein [Kitasatospora sp. NPDC088134]|uniref:hypothetical protein n=1 Tax=Kitasatospora sp. NPDC088134 TaxID=3364071 RepID=UPI00382DE9F5
MIWFLERSHHLKRLFAASVPPPQKLWICCLFGSPLFSLLVDGVTDLNNTSHEWGSDACIGSRVISR